MSKKDFTKEQINNLLKNKNVVRCSNKSITFSKDFKILVIKKYHDEGVAVRDIFKDEGLDINVIGKDHPKTCLVRWNKIFRAKGYDGLITDNRGKTKYGGKSKIRDLCDADKIKRLETEVAYLKAENDFLIKLRNGKAE